jgi:hypothetical protein
VDFKRIYNWFNNKKSKGSVRQKLLTKKFQTDASAKSSKDFFEPKVKKREEDAEIKIGRHKIKQFKREDVVLYLYGEEIEACATKACHGSRGGFKWINERSAIIENRFKPNTEDAFSDEEIRRIDNEVQRWNEKELPPSIQAK